MLKLTKLANLLVVMLVVSSCAVSPHNRMDVEARQHVDNVDGYVAVTQEEVYVDIEGSNITSATGGGALFALIDIAINNSRAKSAEQLIQPVRSNLIDYDYAVQIHQSIHSELSTIEWMTLSNSELVRVIGDGYILDKVEKSDASAVLFVTVNYKLSAKFDYLILEASLLMYPNKEELYAFKESLDNNEKQIDVSDNIYRNVVTVSEKFPVSGEKEDNAVRLGNLPRESIVDIFVTASEKLARQIKYDLMLDESNTK